MTNSEHELEFTFAKNALFAARCTLSEMRSQLMGSALRAVKAYVRPTLNAKRAIDLTVCVARWQYTVVQLQPTLRASSAKANAHTKADIIIYHLLLPGRLAGWSVVMKSNQRRSLVSSCDL